MHVWWLLNVLAIIFPGRPETFENSTLNIFPSTFHNKSHSFLLSIITNNGSLCGAAALKLYSFLSSITLQREFVNILQEKLKNFLLERKKKERQWFEHKKEQPRVNGAKREGKNVNIKRAGSAHKKKVRNCAESQNKQWGANVYFSEWEEWNLKVNNNVWGKQTHTSSWMNGGK